MSKSDPSEMSRISLLDPPDVINKKIKRCKTDPIKGLTFDDRDRPECHNLLTLYALLSDKTKAEVADECQDMGWGQFKPLLTQATIESLSPIQGKYREIMADKGYLESVLAEGREKASESAEEVLARVKTALGFSTPVRTAPAVTAPQPSEPSPAPQPPAPPATAENIESASQQWVNLFVPIALLFYTAWLLLSAF